MTTRVPATRLQTNLNVNHSNRLKLVDLQAIICNTTHDDHLAGRVLVPIGLGLKYHKNYPPAPHSLANLSFIEETYNPPRSLVTDAGEMLPNEFCPGITSWLRYMIQTDPFLRFFCKDDSFLVTSSSPTPKSGSLAIEETIFLMFPTRDARCWEMSHD